MNAIQKAVYPFSKLTKKRFGIVLSSPYGMRTRNGKKEFHDGADYAPTKNKKDAIEIIASMDGDLITDKDKYGGLWSYIKGNDGRGYLTVHHEKFLKRSGKVRKGEPIAIMGNSGKSTAKHVHFEIRSKYWHQQGDRDPEQINLGLFDETNLEPPLQAAIEWNDLIKQKGLTKASVRVIEVEGGNEDSALINRLDNEDLEDLLVHLHKLTSFIQSRSKLKNNPRTDLILERFAYYLRKSTAV